MTFASRPAGRRGTHTTSDQTVKEARYRSGRQHPLRGDLGKKTVGGVEYEHWQYEATGGGRVWYVIDEAKRTVIMTHIGYGHPKETGR